MEMVDTLGLLFLFVTSGVIIQSISVFYHFPLEISRDGENMLNKFLFLFVISAKHV